MSENRVRVLVLVAAGTNCDRETVRAFRRAGAEAKRVHVHELIDVPEMLQHYQIITIPGGFSYGDDLGAGRIFGNEIRFLLGETVQDFVEKGGLVLGICNGFQVLVRAGLLPGFQKDRQTVTLAENDSGRFECRWTHLEVCNSTSDFLPDSIDSLFLPVAHAEGKFIPGGNGTTRSEHLVRILEEQSQVVLKYRSPSHEPASYPWNPNGSVHDIAAISDSTGRILGMMPHPERFYEQFQHPAWQRGQVSSPPDGLSLIQNGVEAAEQRL